MNTKGFFESALVRQSIWYKKEILGAPYPWSDDEKFNNVFFCNVFRKQDKTTKTILRAVTGKSDMIRKLIVARNLSNNETIKALIAEGWFEGAFDFKALDSILLSRKNAGLTVHTSGFMVCSAFMEKYKLPGYIAQAVDVEAIEKAPTIEALVNYLKSIMFVGPFMAYEYATDLSYFREYPDALTWSNPGPGAIRGMSRILYGEVRRDKEGELKKGYQEFSRELFKEWNAYIRSDEALDRMNALLPNGTEAFDPFFNLTMREVEHWLCEYDKYKRSGKNKRGYPMQIRR